MSETHTFHPTVLREYDIRGIIGETLGEADARAIGLGFGTMVRRAGGTRVAVGYDGRLSSPDLEAALVDGLKSTGLEVIRVGRGPTPMLYYAAYELGADGGVMVTGSHNPPNYNGFKFVLQNKAFFGDQILEIGRLAEAGNWEQGAGSDTHVEMEDRYVARVAGDGKGAEGLTVVWDPGNGAAGRVTEKLCAALPGRHVTINTEIDGTFPNHHPDPTIPENLVQLVDKVKEEGADIGIGFDGDGDRIGVVDKTGAILWGDQIMIILAMDVLERHKGAPIIADVKTSQVFFDEITRLGGEAVMWKTGHSLIKQRMAEMKAPLAGEMSGHIFFADGYYGYDDGIYTGVRLIDIIGRRGIDLPAFRDGLPPVYNTPETRFEVTEERKFAIVEEVKARLAESGANVNGIDGVRVLTEDGWWLLRASNTQNVLVARCESESSEGLERLKATVSDQLSKSGVAAPF